LLQAEAADTVGKLPAASAPAGGAADQASHRQNRVGSGVSCFRKYRFACILQTLGLRSASQDVLKKRDSKGICRVFGSKNYERYVSFIFHWRTALIDAEGNKNIF
jgi:hypothetical protein